MKTKFKARVAAETLSDDSIVFNVLHGSEIIASPATEQEAQKIRDDWNDKNCPTVRPSLRPWRHNGFKHIVARDNTRVADMNDGFGEELMRANARLIVAAPELFKVLCEIRDGVNAGRIRLEVVKDGGNPTAGGLWMGICDAVAKAAAYIP